VHSNQRHVIACASDSSSHQVIRPSWAGCSRNRLSLSVPWLQSSPLRGDITTTVDFFSPWYTITLATVRWKLSDRLPGVCDERTTRRRLRGRSVKQITRITLVAICYVSRLRCSCNFVICVTLLGSGVASYGALGHVSLSFQQEFFEALDNSLHLNVFS
jgi:hypothetical protein